MSASLPRRALLVGFNDYDHFTSLSACVRDVDSMARILSRHEDGSTNYSCQTLTSPGDGTPIDRVTLREMLETLFHFDGEVFDAD